MRNAISPCDPPPQSVAYVAVPSVGVLAGVAVTRDIVVEATLSTPCDVLCPSLACFLSVSRCPWRIASQKQKLLLASQFVFLLLLLFPWCRSVGPPLFYLYSSAVVILLHEEEREVVGNVPTFALIFGPLRAGGGEVGWLSSPSLLSFPRSPLP